MGDSYTDVISFVLQYSDEAAQAIIALRAERDALLVRLRDVEERERKLREASDNLHQWMLDGIGAIDVPDDVYVPFCAALKDAP